MQRFLLVLVTLFLAATSHPAAAQTKFLNSSEQTKQAAEAIVASVSASNLNGALAEFKSLSVIHESDFEEFKVRLAGAQEKLQREFGLPTGYEYVRLDTVGTRVLRHQFLVFHENAPIVWNFVFYKHKNGWVVSHLHFDGNSLKLFP